MLLNVYANPMIGDIRKELLYELLNQDNIWANNVDTRMELLAGVFEHGLTLFPELIAQVITYTAKSGMKLLIHS